MKHRDDRVFEIGWIDRVWVCAVLLGLIAAAVHFAPGNWRFVAPCVLLVVWFPTVNALLSRHPILSVGRSGVGGFPFKGHTVPWIEIADIEVTEVVYKKTTTQNAVLVLKDGSPYIERTKRLFDRGPRRRVMWVGMGQSEQKSATEVLQKAFKKHAKFQAQVSEEQVQIHEQRAVELEKQLQAWTPDPLGVYFVIVANTLAWFIHIMSGVHPATPSSADLLSWGANSSSSVVQDHEVWRLFAATLLHAGWLHLALNMAVLGTMGRQVCHWFGNGQFLLIYVLSGIAASATSLHFSASESISVGASGAVFGVLGALLAGVYQHQDRLPRPTVQRILGVQGGVVGGMLVQGFLQARVDNAAHLGGFLAGACIGWILLEKVDPRRETQHGARFVALATIGTAVVVTGLVLTAPPGIDHKREFAWRAAVNRVEPGLLLVHQAFDRDAATLTGAALARQIESRHLPALRTLGDRMTLRTPSTDPMRNTLADLNGATIEVAALELAKVHGTVTPAQVVARQRDLAARTAAAQARLVRLVELSKVGR